MTVGGWVGFLSDEVGWSRLAVMSKYDNMNYFGVTGAIEMLTEVAVHSDMHDISHSGRTGPNLTSLISVHSLTH